MGEKVGKHSIIKGVIRRNTLITINKIGQRIR